MHSSVKKSILTLGMLAVLAAASVYGAEAAKPCPSDQAHEFDFWIGEWDVYAGGQKAGTNSIQPILDGCVLQETWSGAQGSAGSSLNFHNPRTNKWQQFWVWRNGTTLELSGSFADGKMVLEGEGQDQEGKKLRNRITWYDNEDGTVRQHWEQSRDKGKTWQTSFDGMYKKKGKKS